MPGSGLGAKNITLNHIDKSLSLRRLVSPIKALWHCRLFLSFIHFFASFLSYFVNVVEIWGGNGHMNLTPYFFPTFGRLLPEENTFYATFLKGRALYLKLWGCSVLLAVGKCLILDFRTRKTISVTCPSHVLWSKLY